MRAPGSTKSSIHDSKFDQIIKYRWENAVGLGLCRYRLDHVENKVLPGKYNFVVQYNPEKSKPGWRRACQNFQMVNEPFDSTQFNFNQIKPQEILMISEELAELSNEPDTILVINASPLEFGSCILVPQVTQNIPQSVTRHGLEVLLKIVLSSTNPHLKGGFSSPGGCASVNHQHYHLYYQPEQLYLETSPVEHIAGPCFVLNNDYPSKGFAFQLEDDPSQLARHVFTLVDFMRQNEIAHNMFITRGRRFQKSSTVIQSDVYDTVRVFVWARESVFGAKKDYGMNPALCELAGYLLTTDVFEYEGMTEEYVCNVLENLTGKLFPFVLKNINHLFSVENSK